MLSTIFGLLQAASPDDVLTLNEVLADIPHDPPAFVVYAMVAFSLYLLWRSNRPKRPRV